MTNRSLRAAAAALFIVGLATVGLAAPAQAGAPRDLRGCEFGKAQVFDTQYELTSSRLSVRSMALPYVDSIAGGDAGQLTDSTLLDTDYFRFVESTSITGALALEQFDSTGTSKGVVDDPVTFRALGADFIFLTNSNSNGTLITTGAGFARGSSQVFPVTTLEPTTPTAEAYAFCTSQKFGAGEGRSVTQPPVTTPPSHFTKTIVPFAANKAVLTKELRASIRSFVKKHPTSTKIKCVGQTSNSVTTPFDVTLATARAKAACSYAKSLNGNITSTKIAIRTGEGVGSQLRRVIITLNNPPMQVGG